MVGVAISKIGLVANGQLNGNVVANVVIVAHLLVNYFDVWIKLVKFCDIDIQNFSEVTSHGVVKINGDLTSVVTALGDFKCCFGCILFAAAEHCCHAEKHYQRKEKRKNSVFHVG